MTESHLRNCLKMLYDRAEDFIPISEVSYNPFDDDTEAYYCFESDMEVEECNPFYVVISDFETELKRRGLKV